ncbi:MAG: FAD-dependent oxidoreductase [Oscillospiraceae bacterium]|nr:FAD-dependent oxidoreductase [Oscillospiraceae bacterium]
MICFPHLFSPITIAGKTYQNRICAAPVHAQKIRANGELLEYETRLRTSCAAGGFASICMGDIMVDPKYQNFPDAPDFTVFDSPQAEGYRKIAALMKEHGAVALAQLGHVGAHRMFNCGWETVGPCDLIRDDGMIVRAMDEKDMLRACGAFADAAFWFQSMGFDGVMVHAGHGYLLSEFLSPRDNHRTDKYGGSRENQARFPVRVVQAIRDRCGTGFIIEVRVSGTEDLPGGIEPDDIVAFGRQLEGIADILHISRGNNNFNLNWLTHQYSNFHDPHFINLDIAAYIKERVNLVISVVGGINSPEEAEQAIAEGKTDLVALGRQIFADPDFPNKAKNGHADDINRCLRCGACNGNGSPSVDFFPLIANDRPHCTVNPMFYRAGPIPKPEHSRRVLVAGGGAAGMQAAITAADQGHKVTLVERNNWLGGTLRFTGHELHKADLKNFKDLLIRRVHARNVKVRMNTVCDASVIQEEQPDVILAAVGSTPILPPIPGAKEYAVPVLDVFEGVEIGQNVVMLGGGLGGCDTALHLVDQGKTVTIIEMQPEVPNGGTNGYKQFTRQAFREKGVIVRTYLKCVAVRPDGVDAEDVVDGTLHHFQADTVIMSLGMRPNRSVVEALQVAANGIPVIPVGDAVTPKTVMEAVWTGCSAALEIQ